MANSPEEIVNLANTTLFIIDDSRAFLAGTQELLKEHSCNVHSFLDPKKALLEIPLLQPDIIVTDLEMPTMNGIEFTRAVRATEQGKLIPILVLTSKNDPQTLISVISAGADSFVGKDSVRDVLVANLFALVRLKKVYNELTKMKQLSAIQSMIGTYRHEFGNTLAILQGKTRKLERELPAVIEQDAFKSIQICSTRFETTLKKLNEIREFQEEKYSDNSTIVKID